MTRITPTQASILERIGGTSLIHLRSLVPRTSARILLKIESENPTGSMKDRMALAMIEAAEQDGRLTRGGNVVEYTGGSTGVSLALVCAVKRYPLHIVTSDAFSIEKRNHMRALGADLTLVASEGGGLSAALTRNMIERARQIRARTGGFWTDQLNNADQLAAYRNMGGEIWRQTEGKVDAFVSAIGTGGTLSGTGIFLKERSAGVRIVLADPHGAAMYNYFKHGELKSEGSSITEGIGQGRITGNLEGLEVDQPFQIPDEEAIPHCFQLLEEEGLSLGGSSGMNVAGAVRLAKVLGPGHTIVTILADYGTRYSSKLYNPAFLREKGLPVPDWLT